MDAGVLDWNSVIIGFDAGSKEMTKSGPYGVGAKRGQWARAGGGTIEGEWLFRRTRAFFDWDFGWEFLAIKFQRYFGYFQRQGKSQPDELRADFARFSLWFCSASKESNGWAQAGRIQGILQKDFWVIIRL